MPIEREEGNKLTTSYYSITFVTIRFRFVSRPLMENAEALHSYCRDSGCKVPSCLLSSACENTNDSAKTKLDERNRLALKTCMNCPYEAHNAALFSFSIQF